MRGGLNSHSCGVEYKNWQKLQECQKLQKCTPPLFQVFLAKNNPLMTSYKMPSYFLLYYLSFRLNIVNKLQNVCPKIKTIPTIESEKLQLKYKSSFINSWLSLCVTARRGSSTGFSLVSPTNDEVCKSSRVGKMGISAS